MAFHIKRAHIVDSASAVGSSLAELDLSSWKHCVFHSLVILLWDEPLSEITIKLLGIETGTDTEQALDNDIIIYPSKIDV